MKNIEIRGYSERGMINAISFEMFFSKNCKRMLSDFLSLFRFPNKKPISLNFDLAKVRIEQSFSDFGNLDLLILLCDELKQSFLLEAKVKTFNKNWWISREWDNFREVLSGKRQLKDARSNLFIQLYRKMRLIRKVRNDDNLEENIFGKRWSLGKNDIVIKAAKELSDFCKCPWFLAIIPCSNEEYERFISENPFSLKTKLKDWNPKRFGFLLWEDLEKYCQKNRNLWPFTLDNFKYNNGQIFVSEKKKKQSHTPNNKSVK